MGLGAWLAATTERKHYEIEEQRELREIAEKPQEEEEEIYTIFAEYGVDRARVAPIVEGLKSNPDLWIKVGAHEPTRRGEAKAHAVHDGFRTETGEALALWQLDSRVGHGWLVLHGYATTVSTYSRDNADVRLMALGGLIPLIPYFAIRSVNEALFVSIGITVAVLLIFGYVKAIFTGTTKGVALLSAAQTLLVGAIAAGTSYGIVRGVNSATLP